MPGRGAVTFGDLVGKVELLRLECSKCGRSGRYRVARLMRECGPEATLTEWRERLTADCPRQARNAADPCIARFPDLVTARYSGAPHAG